MNRVTSFENVKGQRKKTETITYRNGNVVKRIYDRVNDIVPSDIIQVKTNAPVGKIPVMPIEHREVALYRQHYNC